MLDRPTTNAAPCEATWRSNSGLRGTPLRLWKPTLIVAMPWDGARCLLESPRRMSSLRAREERPRLMNSSPTAIKSVS